MDTIECSIGHMRLIVTQSNNIKGCPYCEVYRLRSEIERLNGEIKHVRNYWDGACECRFNDKDILIKECDAHRLVREEVK